MLAAGDRVGDYEIEATLGEGGMATVYRARHVLLDTHHAIKILDPELRANADARQRFLDEARIQAKHLDHPGIVKVTNIVATSDHAALIMELVEGKSLEDEIGTLSTDHDEIRRIMIALLEAIGYAHDKGIVHRDLKPANVLLAGPKRMPKVTDFGIAKATQGEGAKKKKSTHADARMGTLNYMSPEQIRSAKNVTNRSDIFSLGAMLYELATGKVPFDAENDFDVMAQIVNGKYEPPAVRNPKIDPVIAQVIAKALEVDPEKRYASCSEMATALRGSMASAIRIGVAPERPQQPATPVAPAKREGKVGLWMALGAVVILGGGALAYMGFLDGEPEVRGPKASDLAAYTKDLTGSGPLMASIETSRGTIHCELFEKQTPRTVANFVGLATGKKPWRNPMNKQVMRGKPYYDGLMFHRANATGTLGGGGRVEYDEWNPGYTFADEPVAGLAPQAGSLVMWTTAPHKNGGQFAIYHREDQIESMGETIFGKCKEVDLVRRLAAADPKILARFEPSPIRKVEIYRDGSAAALDSTTPSTGRKGVGVKDERLEEGFAFNASAKGAPDPSQVYAVPVYGSPSIGPPSLHPPEAKITIVVAFDYQCPKCEEAEATLEKIRDTYGDDVRFVFKQLIMPFHADKASVPALAACAASRMGFFYAMHRTLWNAYRAKDFELAVAPNADRPCWQTDAGCTKTVERARAVATIFNEDKFKTAMRGICVDEVANDMRLMKTFGVPGTPSFFINGRFLGGLQSLDAFNTLIDAELELANKRIGVGGTTAANYYDRWVLGTGKSRAD